MPTLSRPATAYEIRVNGYPDTRLRLITCQQSMGGHATDFAQVAFDFGPAGVVNGDPRQAHLIDVALERLNIGPGGTDYTGAICEIVLVRGGVPEVIHYGRLSLAQCRITEQGEGLQLVSRFERQMYGSPLTFQRVLDPDSGQLAFIDEPCVFNPEIDGVSYPNRRVARAFQTPASIRPLFIHPESLRTIQAAFYQGAVTPLEAVLAGEVYESPAVGWTLAEAVKYLCAECNPFERYVENPSDNGLLILDDDPSTLRHHLLRPGLFLNEALDELLTPYGYTWRIEYFGFGNRRIAILRQGNSPRPPVPMLLQRPGEALDVAQSDAIGLDLDIDTGAIINQVRVVGGYTQVEATFELIPAWPESLDTTDILNLLKNRSQWNDNPQYHRVHRDWVLNEAGDYNGLRSGNTPYPLTELFRLVFGPNHPLVCARRRRFLPTLTTKRHSQGSSGAGGENQPIGEQGGITIQWLNPYKIGGGGWDEIHPSDPLHSVKILTTECGIRFDGDRPPWVLLQSVINGGGRLRVTATVESDSRLSYTAPRRATSLAFDIAELILDMPHSFHLRKLVREGTGDGRSIYDATPHVALEADSRAAIANFAELLRAHWDLADVSGRVQIEGLDRNKYRLGDTVDVVHGRNIRVAASDDTSLGIYPQIVVRQFDVQEQREILTIATTRRDVHEVLRLASRSERVTGRRTMNRRPSRHATLRGG